MTQIEVHAETVDLANCAREPIHIPGAIQPHGVLLACRPSFLEIVQASASVVQHFGRRPESILGRPLTELLDPPSAARLLASKDEAALRAVNPLHLRTIDDRGFEAALHRPPSPDDLIVVELEPAGASAYGVGGPMFDPRLRSAILRLQNARDITTLNRIAAEEVRELTGFDRVMIYNFDADWNGEVVAEARREDLDSFLGQHYPASDIPSQARRLYELNWLRLIADVGYRPSPLVALEPGPPLDMSFAVLRSVSPIHIEYLKNMGVGASMSISLLREGKLAGLIACHHYSGAHRVPFGTRETTEYLGQALSWHTNVLRAAELADRARRVQEHEGEIVRSISSTDELIDGLATEALVALPRAAGAAVVLAEGVRNIGHTPSAADVRAIVSLLRTIDADVWSTDKLSDHLPAAARLTQVAAGLLAVAVSRDLGEYILWFRPEEEQVIDWAGNPHHVKLTRVEGQAGRLSPRGSFALWRETVRGRSLPWQEWEVSGASSLRRVLLGGIRRRAAELRSLNERLVEADRAKDNFIATVSHELRTPLNAIGGWTTLLRGGKLPADKMAHAIEVIARNVETQSQLVEDLLDVSRMTSGKLTLEIEHVDLGAIVESTLESMALAMEARAIDFSADMDPSAATVLGDATRLRQVVGNLLSNAVKFTPKGGSIRLLLRQRDTDIELAVTDTGKGIPTAFLPHVFEPFRQADDGMNRRSQGLGLGLAIVRRVVELHGGQVLVESAGENLGATFRVVLPRAAKLTVPPSALAAAPAPESRLDTPAELAGLRLLVVEDDADSRELVQHVLERCGAIVTTAPDASTALTLLEDASRFDVVVSDIGLPDTDGFALVRQLRTRSPAQGGKLPAVALTAYTRAVDRTRSLQAGFQAHVPKPVDPNELVAVVASVVRRR